MSDFTRATDDTMIRAQEILKKMHEACLMVDYQALDFLTACEDNPLTLHMHNRAVQLNISKSVNLHWL